MVRQIHAGLIVALCCASCGDGGEGPTPDAAVGADAREEMDAREQEDAGPLDFSCLSTAGFYANGVAGELQEGIRPFGVAYPLWSDGADKRRFIYLPPGTQIDTSEIDHWRFPVGTRFYKEFSKDGVRLETRLIARLDDTGDDDVDFWMGAFVWREDQSDACLTETGVENVLGTEHDVPSRMDCWRCHVGAPGRSLGFGAIQLAHQQEGWTLEALVANDKLSHPPTDTAYRVPGDSRTSAALGYLHANCGHCHSDRGPAWRNSDQVLRLYFEEREPEATQLYQSTVNQSLQYWMDEPFTYRVVSGSPETSGLLYRMTVRADRDAMPPLATEVTDDAGLDLVRDWIEGLDHVE